MKASILAFAPLVALAAAHPRAVNVTRTATRTITSRQAQSAQNQPWQAGDFWEDGYNNVYAVSGEMVVPSTTYMDGAAESQAVTFWVGIWGDDCGFDSNLLQAGIQGVNTGGGDSWRAFAEWAPQGPIYWDFAVNDGDTVSFQVVLDSSTSGTATVKNLSNGGSGTFNLGGDPVCAGTAEWIVEDYYNADGYANSALSNFGSVTMTNCLAIADDQYFNAGDGGPVYMIENGQSQVGISISGTDVTFQYAG